MRIINSDNIRYVALFVLELCMFYKAFVLFGYEVLVFVMLCDSILRLQIDILRSDKSGSIPKKKNNR